MRQQSLSRVALQTLHFSGKVLESYCTLLHVFPMFVPKWMQICSVFSGSNEPTAKIGPWAYIIAYTHSLASASRLMPLVSAFRHLTSQSGTGAFWYRTVPASAFFFIPVPDWFRHLHSFSFRYRTDWMPENSAFHITKTVRKVKGGHPARPLHTAGGGETPCRSIIIMVSRNTSCTYLYGSWWYYPYFVMLTNHN